MDKKLHDLLYTLSANILNMVLGIITALLIPKFLGIEEYGYLNIFIFYLGYTGFMHLGFIDGVYVKYGKYDYNELPKEKFRSYFRFLLIFQILIALILGIITKVYIGELIRQRIIYFICINMILINFITFFSFINQFTRRFKVYSINLILTKLLYVAGSVLFFVLGFKNHMYFIVLLTTINVIILVKNTMKDKELIFGKSESIRENFLDIKNNIYVGFFVMIGTFISILIIGIDRLFIDKFFSLKDFSMYSFAFSVLSIFYVLINSITTVIYPYLARTDEQQIKKGYKLIKTLLIILIGASLSGFFILKIIILSFLPKYIDALGILIILTPTVLLSGQNTILIANYYKVLKFQKEYALNNIIALALGISTSIIAYIFFKSTTGMASAALASFIFWVTYSDHFFIKKFNIKLTKIQILEFLVIILFLLIAYSFNWYMGLIIYLFAFTILIIVVCNRELKDILVFFKNKKTQ